MKIFSFILLLLCATFPSFAATQSIQELMEEAGTTWMIGSWEGKGEDGQVSKISFRFELDKRVVVTQSQNPRWSAMGLTGVDPDSGKVKYNGYSSNGSALLGEWTGDNGVAVLTVKLIRSNGETTSMALRHRKTGDSTMLMELLEVDSSGEVVEPPRTKVEFTRAKEK